MAPQDAGIWTKPQQEWLETKLPEYIAKTGTGKKPVQGQPLPIDDSDLLTWVDGRRIEFEKQFKAELDKSISDGAYTDVRLRRAFKDYFRNRKSRAKVRWDKQAASGVKTLISRGLVEDPSVTPSSSTSQPIKGEEISSIWSKFLSRHAVTTGRSLFENENRQTVSQQINERRELEGINHHQHAGMLKVGLKELWDGLDEEEQSVWRAKAKVSMNAATTLSLGQQMYMNQPLVLDSIAALLIDAIGPPGLGDQGNHKIGNARFHILFAYRDMDDVLKTGCLDLTDSSLGLPPFDTSNNDYAETVMRPWVGLCEQTIDVNFPAPEPSLSLSGPDEEGVPMLPVTDESTLTVETLRKTLSVYFDAQWELYRSSISSAEYALPWSSCLSAISDPSISLQNPATATPFTLFAMLAEFQKRQTAIRGFRLFSEPRDVLNPPSSTLTQSVGPSRTSGPIPTPATNLPSLAAPNAAPAPPQCTSSPGPSPPISPPSPVAQSTLPATLLCTSSLAFPPPIDPLLVVYRSATSVAPPGSIRAPPITPPVNAFSDAGSPGPSVTPSAPPLVMSPPLRRSTETPTTPIFPPPRPTKLQITPRMLAVGSLSPLTPLSAASPMTASGAPSPSPSVGPHATTSTSKHPPVKTASNKANRSWASAGGSASKPQGAAPIRRSSRNPTGKRKEPEEGMAGVVHAPPLKKRKHTYIYESTECKGEFYDKNFNPLNADRTPCTQPRPVDGL